MVFFIGVIYIVYSTIVHYTVVSISMTLDKKFFLIKGVTRQEEVLGRRFF